MILLDTQLSTEPAEVATLEEAIGIIDKLEFELANSKTPGIGLAAPQIGIPKAVAIIRIHNPYDKTNPYNINLVNPKIIEAHDLIEYDEGCLSFPGLSAKTIRHNEIVIETASDYEYYSLHINAKRYNFTPEEQAKINDTRRKIYIGNSETDHPKIRVLSQLLSVCVQHEFSHLLGLTMFDFEPKEINRNDKCPCDSGKKNKKCHNYKLYNTNLNKLFKPNYRGI